MAIKEATPEYLFSTLSPTLTRILDVTALDDGRLFVVWHTRDAQNSPDVRGQFLNPDGTPSSADFLLNSSLAGYQGLRNVVQMADGRILAVRTQVAGGLPSPRAAILSADGTSLRSDFALLPGAVTGDSIGDITPLANGGFAAAFMSLPSNIYATGYIRIFNAAGDPVTGAIAASSVNKLGQLEAAELARRFALSGRATPRFHSQMR